jgi:hypothetical protein
LMMADWLRAHHIVEPPVVVCAAGNLSNSKYCGAAFAPALRDAVLVIDCRGSLRS